MIINDLNQSNHTLRDEGTLCRKGAASSLFAIIVAGGSGLRAGGGLPKQFHILAGRQVMIHAVEAFLDADPSTRIVVVTHPYYRNLAEEGLTELYRRRPFYYEIAEGGNTRAESVRNGLDKVPSGDDILVAVHDGARPLVTPELIRRGWESAARHGAAVCCVPVTDSLRWRDDDFTSHAVDRSRFLAVQTPQTFISSILKKAYSQPLKPTFTDDASVVEADGGTVAVFDGDTYNIKITSPFDFDIAELILRNRLSKKV